MDKRGCKHSRLMPLLNHESCEKINGGNLAWCKTCGCIRHINLDGRVGWATPTYERKNTDVRWEWEFGKGTDVWKKTLEKRK